MPSVNGHEFVQNIQGQPFYWCYRAPGGRTIMSGMKSTLVGQYCPNCGTIVDGPYAGQEFDVAPWERGALVGVEDA